LGPQPSHLSRRRKEGLQGRRERGVEGRERGGGSKRDDVYFLGDDMAYKDPESKVLRFVFGGKTQSEEEFDMRVKAKFKRTFPVAWKPSNT